MPGDQPRKLLDLKYTGGLEDTNYLELSDPRLTNECQIIRIKNNRNYAYPTTLQNGGNELDAAQYTITFTKPDSPYASRTTTIVLLKTTWITLEEIQSANKTAVVSAQPAAVDTGHTSSDKSTVSLNPIAAVDAGPAGSDSKNPLLSKPATIQDSPLTECTRLLALLICGCTSIACCLPVCLKTIFSPGRRKFNEEAFLKRLNNIEGLQTTLNKAEIVTITDALKAVHANTTSACCSLPWPKDIITAIIQQFNRDTTLAGKVVGDDYGHGGEGGTGPIYYL